VAIVEVHPESIDGPWTEGFVLDAHVVSTRPIGYIGEHLRFDIVRSPLGELVYRLKYDHGSPIDIVGTAVAFIEDRWHGALDCVVFPPPSLYRTKQPVAVIAEGVASALHVPLVTDALVKPVATPQMKTVPIPERVPLLSATIHRGNDSVKDKRVLLIDDMWETGSTLRRVAEVLGYLGAAEVRALVMTRTT